MSELANFLQMVESLAGQPNVTRPSDLELRQAAERYGTRTSFGNYTFHTMVKNRSPIVTPSRKNSVRASRHSFCTFTCSSGPE